jgi:hypothetical protein
MAVVLQPHGDIKNLNVAAHIACQNGMYEKIERCQIEKLPELLCGNNIY